MLFLKILLGIILALALILLLRVKISVITRGGQTKLLLRILGIPIKLYPKKPKKQRIRLKDFTPRALRRAQRKKDKKALKESLKAKHGASDGEKTSLTETVSTVTGLVKTLSARLFKHLRIDITKISISVGTPDAAKTGILYGTVCQGVAYLLEVLDRITNVKKKKKTEVSVSADFVSGKTNADIDLSFSLTVWQALDILFSTALEYIKSKTKANKNRKERT